MALEQREIVLVVSLFGLVAGVAWSTLAWPWLPITLERWTIGDDPLVTGAASRRLVPGHAL